MADFKYIGMSLDMAGEIPNGTLVTLNGDVTVNAIKYYNKNNMRELTKEQKKNLVMICKHLCERDM